MPRVPSNFINEVYFLSRLYIFLARDRVVVLHRILESKRGDIGRVFVCCSPRILVAIRPPGPRCSTNVDLLHSDGSRSSPFTKIINDCNYVASWLNLALGIFNTGEWIIIITIIISSYIFWNGQRLKISPLYSITPCGLILVKIPYEK